MIKLGEIQTLKIVKKVEFGVYLADEGQNEEQNAAERPRRRRRYCFREDRFRGRQESVRKWKCSFTGIPKTG